MAVALNPAIPVFPAFPMFLETAVKVLSIPRMRRSVIALVALAATLVPGALRAQRVERRILPELRADVVTGDVVSGQLAGGLHVNTGTYVRLALLAGFGAAWKDNESGHSIRFEVQGRFHLDPFRNAQFGLYGLGGVATSHDPFAEWQSRLVAGAGIELPAHERATWAIEAAFAGGFRLTFLTRRLTLGQR